MTAIIYVTVIATGSSIPSDRQHQHLCLSVPKPHNLLCLYDILAFSLSVSLCVFLNPTS